MEGCKFGEHGRHIELKLAEYIKNKNKNYVFVLNMEIDISFFYNYLLLDGFENVYLKFDSVFSFLAQARF